MKSSKYSKDMKESIYNDYINGFTYSRLADKYELTIPIITSILSKEKIRHLYINTYRKKIEMLVEDCERLIINGCNSAEIYNYFCKVKPQLKVNKKWVYNKVIDIKRKLWILNTLIL